jgi:hypothetical protein
MSNLRPLPISTRRLEDLPSDGGRTVDTIAGGLLRLFVRVEGLEKRLKVLEQGRTPQSTNGQEKPRV